jgi:uncharacterized protein (TIGR00290 family)
MTAATKTLLAWSSGKDSAYALHVLRQDAGIELVGLLTTVNSAVHRVSMHGVRDSLLAAQAEACGLPLLSVPIPDPCSDDEYRAAMAVAIAAARDQGVRKIAFGDLFLADVRRYREEQLAGTGIDPIFPLWGRPTGLLAREIVASGVTAIITCVDTQQLDARFAGRDYDSRLLDELPASVDPCGENGEFHTVVVGGPMFEKNLDVTVGPIVVKERFVFADVSLRPLTQTIRSRTRRRRSDRNAGDAPPDPRRKPAAPTPSSPDSRA